LEAADSILDSVVDQRHTPIPAGALFGPYQIVGLIGAGGMGEVYRARDERLKRDVAIKVLPSLFSQDRDRLRRFEQEARAAGGLNHPNILAIHDIGSKDGAPYVVSELLEGQTLRERLVSGALPARKTIDYGTQVARGLAAAHERGIVHRDLKPENLFITKDGRVKILDFGLAKVTRPEKSGVHASVVSTTLAGTEPGVVMGTVGYMSPEQVRGQAADARSDIFSLGAILYEMLSGKRAFQGYSSVETMSAILKEDPPDLSSTNRNISSGLDRIVRHCLEKSPEERFQSARDLAFDLESLSGLSGQSPAAGAPLGSRLRHLSAPALTVAALALITAAVFAALWSSARARQPAILSFQRLTFRRGLLSGARFAPDGKTVVYSAAWGAAPPEIFTVRTDSTESRSIGLSGADVLSVSSKGELAVLLRKGSGAVPVGTLARIPIGGGTPREILEGVYEADWAPNGEDLAIIRRLPNGKRQVEYPIGNALYEAGDIDLLRVSPGGDVVAFEEVDRTNVATVTTIDRRRNLRRLITVRNFASGLAWSSRGDAVIVATGQSPRERALLEVSLSGRQRVLASNAQDLYLLDVATDGRILAERIVEQLSLYCQPPGEDRQHDLEWLDYSIVRDIARDGSALLFSEDVEGPTTAFLRRTDGSPAIRLGYGIPLALSPESRWALVSTTTGSLAELLLLPTGPGEPRKLSIEGLDPRVAFFLPDGKRFLIACAGKPDDIFVIGSDGGKPRSLRAEGFDVDRRAAISPDGEHIAYSVAGGQIKIASLAGEATRTVPGLPLEPLCRLIQWSADGRFLYIVRRIFDVPALIDRVEIATGRQEPWKELAPEDRAGLQFINPIRIAPDGQSYAYCANRIVANDLFVVEGVR
jgi:tRNA A-37 threonylcarbamoyl transferase component Bud32